MDKDGNLIEDYRTPPMWMGGDDGMPLRLSPKAFVNAASIACVAQADERG